MSAGAARWAVNGFALSVARRWRRLTAGFCAIAAESTSLPSYATSSSCIRTGRSREHVYDRAEQNHWSECGRAASVDNSYALGRPHRSVLPLAQPDIVRNVLYTLVLVAGAVALRCQGQSNVYQLHVGLVFYTNNPTTLQLIAKQLGTGAAPVLEPSGRAATQACGLLWVLLALAVLVMVTGMLAWRSWSRKENGHANR